MKLPKAVGVQSVQSIAVPEGWNSGIPTDPALYIRLTALGPKVDVWDGLKWWTAETNSNGNRSRRIECANQDLPWRVWDGLVPPQVGLGRI